MIDSLNIGKYIFATLKNIKDVGIYPLVADNDAQFPFMVYKRTNLVSSGCKDGYYEDSVTIEINIVTDRYYKGIDFANQVRELLEVSSTSFGDMEISDSNLILASEDYSNNAFIQKMQFNLKINN